MKLRHVRVVAVTAVVLVALTGARKSGGGGCSGDGHDSSSTSTSGGITSGGSTTGGGSSGSGSSGGSSTRNSAENDITIEDCQVSAADRKVTARLRVDNSTGLSDAMYNITVEFEDARDQDWGTAFVTGFQVPAGGTATAEATGIYTGTGDGSEVTECEVSRASKY
ncbi:hypothetical protein GCM10010420_05630 [Streptomyces glaucosporus]|uniref:Secreted protein n=1 Tax=Streptomyces glaucosporus TaxID=284044 RepID=A0ABP5UTY4_9ACTN